MTLDERISKFNFLSFYIITISTVMILQVAFYQINEHSEWAIRKWFMTIIPESLEELYFSFLLLLYLFSAVNIYIVGILSLVFGIHRKKIMIPIIGFIAAFSYYQMVKEIGDGLI
jgi:hypothetical protein